MHKTGHRRGATRVLIVDDSIAAGRFLTGVLSRDPELEVVGHARDAYEAREMVKTRAPDVLTLDVELPGMDGITFLKNLMRLHPMPVVMLSNFTAPGSPAANEALEAGALDVLGKPCSTDPGSLESAARAIVATVRRAGSLPAHQVSAVQAKPSIEHEPIDIGPSRRRLKTGRRASDSIVRLVALGASTGGPDALRTLFTRFDAPGCAVVLAQHMPDRFMKPFAERLHGVSSMTVRLAVDNERLEPGTCYVAPGDEHLCVVRRGDALFARLAATDPVQGHRPSVDVLFESVAAAAPAAAIGVLLTGMGEDGARGLAHLQRSGSLTIAQDCETSTVWGMPARAVELGAADVVWPLGEIGRSIDRLVRAVA